MAKAARKEKPKEKSNIVKIAQSGDIDKIRGVINAGFSGVAKSVVNKPTTIIPTGILSMDLAIGNGGMVGGRILDINGWEGTGKTLTTMTIGGYIQRCTKTNNDGNTISRIVAFLDAEGTFDAAFAAGCGLNPNDVILVQSEPEKILSGEDYFDIIAMLVGQGVDYIIVDSCPALTPRAILEHSTDYGIKAEQSQLMSRGLSKIVPLINSSRQSLVHFINQRRGKPMASKWESNEAETGGNALRFYSSYRFRVISSEDIKANVLGADGQFRNKKVGVNSRIEIKKNKTAPIPPNLPSMGNTHFDFDVYFEDFKDDQGMEYNRGVDIVKDYVDTGIRCEVIRQNSSWYEFEGIKANGKPALISKIREEPQVMAKIRDAVFDKMGISGHVGIDVDMVEEVNS